MSYGLSGPPKGYSVPRGLPTGKAAAKRCQRCCSSEHWTFECKNVAAPGSNGAGAQPKQPVTTGISKLSKTQILKLGLKKDLSEEAPPKTEGEISAEKMKELAQESRGHRKRDRVADEIKPDETSGPCHSLETL